MTAAPILAAALALTAAASAAPTGIATHARIWLKVAKDAPPLAHIECSIGHATPALWEKDPALRERQIDFQFPIHWWKWQTATLSFMPSADGKVDLVLNGPWTAGADGSPVRREILWDDLSATGTTLANGSFEETTTSGPSGWQAPWAPYPTPSEWPLAKSEAAAGNHLAATWHNRPLSQALTVKAGQRVTLRFLARAATPPDFTPPARLSTDTPAHHAIQSLKRGVNFGNGWEAPPRSGWGQRFTTADVDHVAAEGFDHIRIPIAWHHYLSKDPQPSIDPSLLTELEPVIKHALNRKLTVIINWHHFNDFTKDPAAHLDRFIAGWNAIATHFRAWPPHLWFELLNEPCEQLEGETLNAAIARTLPVMRRSNPDRILVVTPGRWSVASQLDQLSLPANDDRLIVTIHCYDPFHFTHQGANWVNLTPLRGITYPGPPATPLAVPDALRDNQGVREFIESYNQLPTARNPSSRRGIEEALDTAASWASHFGRPVHLGEFGAHDPADMASRERYLHDVRTLAEARKIPWTLWEWKASFGYWDAKAGKPRFRKALME